MSEEKFKEAHGDLALSQRLVDEMRMSQGIASEGSTMPQDESSPETEETPQDASFAEKEPITEESPEMSMVEQTIKDTMEPYMEEIKGLVEKKDDEPQEVEIKIDGEMKPKEDDGNA